METYAEYLAKQSKELEIPEVLDYYEKNKKLIAAKPQDVRTIGIYYHCMGLGGVEKVISLLIPMWLNMGYKVVLFTQEDLSTDEFRLPGETVRVVLPNAEKDGLGRRLTALEDALLKHEIDVFIDNEWCDAKILWHMLLVKRHGLPFILYTHGGFSVIYRFLDDFSVGSHRIFALSDLVLTLNELNRHFYALAGCNCITVQNPIDPKLLKTSNVTEAYEEYEACGPVDTPHIAWIGRFSAEKRPLDALRVMKKVCERIPGAVLDMVGTGDETETEKARALCKELRLEGNVVFHGFKSDVSDFYLGSTGILMTSETEGYPNVVIEAKAYGKPIFMYELPYLTMTKNGLGIVSAPVGDADGLGSKIIDVLLDENLQKRLEAEAKKSFEEFKTFDHEAQWKNIFARFEKNDNINSKSDAALRGEESDKIKAEQSTEYADDGALILSMIFKDVMIAYNRGLKSIEQYPDFRIGKALLKFPRMIKHMGGNRTRAQEQGDK